MGLDIIIRILKISQYFVTTLSGIFFAGQLINMLKPSLFIKIDPFLGYIPKFFNQILPAAKIDMGYRQVPAGYLITAGLCILIYHIISKRIIPALEDREYEYEEKQQQAAAYVEQVKVERMAERETMKFVKDKDMFYALFELQLQHNDDFKKDEEEIEELKLEYYKVFVSKLKTKYADVDFILKDKIFFVSDNCDIMHPITVDILKILDVIIKISKYNSIKVNILLSYWVDNREAGKMNIFRTLTKINDLGNKNKIIMTKEVYAKIMSLGQKPWCSVKDLGAFRLFNAYNGEDTDVELSEISSIEKSDMLY